MAKFKETNCKIIPKYACKEKKIVLLRWMIKKLTHICLILIALTTLIAGCSNAPDYDARLLAADSLVYEQPEKAKVILSKIKQKSLNASNTAYYNLLLTQASYIGYDENITSKHDSIISQALNYYEKHNKEVEKLARAYIYKGAILEILSKPDSAMWFYKQAYVKASEAQDTFNKGYASLRMGKLLVNHHAYDGRDIRNLEQALSCFRKVKTAKYQIVCLKDLGALYRSKDMKKAKALLNEAISLAENARDTVNLIASLNNLAYAHFMDNDDRQAYSILQRIKSIRINKLDFNVYTTFASVYANLGKPDSARFFLSQAKINAGGDSTLYIEAQSKIAKAQGKTIDFYTLSYKGDRMQFSLLNDPDILKIMYSELSFDKDYDKLLKDERDRKSRIIDAIVGSIILSLLLLALLLYRRSHRYYRLILELKDQSQSQMNELSGLQTNISEMKIKDDQLKDFISSHLGMMREMIEACYHEPKNRIAENMKRIVKFQDSNRDNWVKLYDYIDMEHNNIMTSTRERFPDLDDRDLLLLALTCMKFSYIQTAIIMGYSNATSVSVLKQRLAKKMDLDCTLNEYIERNAKPHNS